MNYRIFLVVLPQYGLTIDKNTYINKTGRSFSEYKTVNYTYSYDTHTDFIKDDMDKNAKMVLLEN